MEKREGFFSSIFHALKVFASSAGFKLWGKRILLGGAAIAALFLAGFCIWLLLPMRKVPQAELLPQAPFAFFSFNLDQESSAFAEIMSKAKERFAGPGYGPARSALVKFLLPRVLPDSVVVV